VCKIWCCLSPPTTSSSWSTPSRATMSSAAAVTIARLGSLIYLHVPITLINASQVLLSISNMEPVTFFLFFVCNFTDGSKQPCHQEDPPSKRRRKESEAWSSNLSTNILYVRLSLLPLILCMWFDLNFSLIWCC
jgi:hypothetical protein